MALIKLHDHFIALITLYSNETNLRNFRTKIEFSDKTNLKNYIKYFYEPLHLMTFLLKFL